MGDTDHHARPLRVLEVGKGPPERGGIPTFLHMVCSGLPQHDVEFLNLTRENVPDGGRMSAVNLKRMVLDFRDVWNHAKGKDVVHIHSSLAPAVTMVRAGSLALAARLRGAKVLVHGHGGRIQLWMTSLVPRLITRASMAAANRVVVVSSGGLAAMETALGSHRVDLVDNGIEVDTFGATAGLPSATAGLPSATAGLPSATAGLPSATAGLPGATAGSSQTVRPPTILYVGVMTPRKGLIDLLEASDILLDRGVDHELTLVGGMPDEGPAAEAAVTEEIERRPAAKMVGSRPRAEMPQAYVDATVFCLPSWWEAGPLSVLEAMATGRPVVGTDVGDIPRMIEDGVTGYVVPAKDPKALAEALEKLLKNPTACADMGRAGRDRVVEKFNSTATVDRVEELMQGLVGKQRRKHIGK